MAKMTINEYFEYIEEFLRLMGPKSLKREKLIFDRKKIKLLTLYLLVVISPRP